jgi:hypothetical protein
VSETQTIYVPNVYKQKVDDLHHLVIPTDDSSWTTGVRLEDHSCISSCGTVRAFFRDLEARLIEQIAEADYVYGCVAWLTSEPILRALVGKGVQIVVQKEDFLRPDCGVDSSWAVRLRSLYAQLRNPLDRYHVGGRAGMMSYCGDPEVDAVRCVGNHNAAKNPAFPRSHHKFVLFGKYDRDNSDPDYPHQWVRPYAVWTGSFNFTKNAGRSFENAVLLNDPLIVKAYEEEWSQILALSEPLDWHRPWASPQWRIGS